MVNRQLISFMGRSKLFVFGQVLVQILLLGFNILATLMVAKSLERLYLGSLTVNFLILLGVVLGVTVVVRVIFSKLSAFLSYQAAAQVRIRLREALYSHLSSPQFMKNPLSQGETIQIAMEGVEQLEVYFGRYLSHFFYSLVAPLILFAVVFPLNAKVALVLFICVPLIPLSIVAVVKIAKRILKGYWGRYGQLGELFLENVEGLTTLKIYEADERKSQEMDEKSEAFRVATMNLLKMQLNSITVMDFVAYGGAALGILLGVWAFLHQGLSLFALVAIVLLSAEFFIPMRQLGSLFHVAMNGLSASERLFEILKSPQLDLPEAYFKEGDNHVELNNLSFSYDGQRPILQALSLKLSQPGLYCLVGPSGCGKSTCAALLSQEVRGYQGSLKIQNQELADVVLPPRFLVRVDHNSFIFSGTVEQNLLMGNPHATKEEMVEVLKEVDLWETLQQKGGLSAAILAHGGNLSGGQRQRLGVARALLANASIYIFDEATSGVDVESEKQILKAIYPLAKEKIVIFITHRLYHCKEAHRIFTLDGGKVVEEGSHEELLAQKGLYEKLFSQQAQWERVISQEDR